jgi:hypothetical protein
MVETSVLDTEPVIMEPVFAHLEPMEPFTLAPLVIRLFRLHLHLVPLSMLPIVPLVWRNHLPWVLVVLGVLTQQTLSLSSPLDNVLKIMFVETFPSMLVSLHPTSFHQNALIIVLEMVSALTPHSVR